MENQTTFRSMLMGRSLVVFGESNFGNNWNVVRQSSNVGSPFNISSGAHAIRVVATMTDQYGTEIDRVTVNLDDECATSIQCTDTTEPPITIPLLLHVLIYISSQGNVEQRSVTTNCSEEDNLLFTFLCISTVSGNLPSQLPLQITHDDITNNVKQSEIHNDGITIIKSIGKDFWWLHPQSMILRKTQSGSQWSNIVYTFVR